MKESIDRDKFLQTYAPFLIKVGDEGNALFIKDSKIGKTAEIYLRDHGLYRNVCDSKDCMHIHYSLALPEISKLFLRRPSG